MDDCVDKVLIVAAREGGGYMVTAGERKLINTYPHADTFYIDDSLYEHYYYGEQMHVFEFVPNGSPLDKDWNKLWWILLRCNWKMRIARFKRKIADIFI